MLYNLWINPYSWPKCNMYIPNTFMQFPYPFLHTYISFLASPFGSVAVTNFKNLIDALMILLYAFSHLTNNG